MKVLIVEPGKYPREADIEHTLEAEQAVVGGTIEAVYPWRDTTPRTTKSTATSTTKAPTLRALSSRN